MKTLLTHLLKASQLAAAIAAIAALSPSTTFGQAQTNSTQQDQGGGNGRGRGGRGGGRGVGAPVRGVYKSTITPHWTDDNMMFWYRNDLKGGTKEFILVDAEKGVRAPA